MSSALILPPASTPTMPRPGRTTVIVGIVVGLHVAALWALQQGLLQRPREVIVPAQIVAELIVPPAPQAPAPPPQVPARPPPAPQPPAAPPPRPEPVKKVVAPQPAPRPAPRPVAQPAPLPVAEAAPTAMAAMTALT